MIGHPGPYVESNGPRVYVPRTVPYLDARRLVRDLGIIESWQRLVYDGKADRFLLGFTNDCRCEDECCGKPVDGECHPDPACLVPAWQFEIVEP